MFDYIFNTIPELSREVLVKDKTGAEKKVHFQTPWARIDYIAGVKEKSGIDVSLYGPEDEVKLRNEIKKAGYSWEGIEKQVTATMIDYLYKKVLRPGITGPAFVCNYPKTMQPLARQNDINPDIVEQWQLVINWWEVIKAYSELVDPKLQRENFEAQWDALAKWDEEATSSDDDFVLAMEYGMAPQSGWGMGIERILALLTGQDNLRDMILFPLMKSDSNEEKSSKKTQLAVTLLNKESRLEKWQELNTIAHLSASFAAREGRKLFELEHTSTADGVSLPMNIQHAIMIKQAHTNGELQKLYDIAKKGWLEVVPFTREMLETSDDRLVHQNTGDKNISQIEYLWILIFGDKKHVEKLTKEYSLYS
jgi:lysyl-tRNA synthetase class 2